MIAAISPEGYVWIVGVAFAICTVALFILAAAANTTLNRYRSRRKSREEAERRRDRPVRVIGGGNCRVSAEDWWAA